MSDLLHSPLKRKLYLKEITPGLTKKLRFDPVPISEDSSFTQYQERLANILPEDRTKFKVLIPFDKELQEIRALKEKVQDLQAQVENWEHESAVKSDIERRKRAIDSSDIEDRLFLCIGNLLKEVLVSLSKHDHSTDGSIDKLQKFADNLTAKQLSEANIPSKYWGSLRKVKEVINLCFTIPQSNKY